MMFKRSLTPEIPIMVKNKNTNKTHAYPVFIWGKAINPLTLSKILIINDFNDFTETVHDFKTRTTRLELVYKGYILPKIKVYQLVKTLRTNTLLSLLRTKIQILWLTK